MRLLRLTAALLVSVAAAALASGCAAEPVEEGEETADELVTSAGEDAPIVVPPAGHMQTLLSQPTLMAALETEGFSLAAHLSGRSTPPVTNDKLLVDPLYRFIADDLAADLDLARAHDPKLSTQVAHGVTRILDKGWLTAAYASMELIGVAPRFDRLAHVAPESCGEVRFLYRLAYRHQKRDPANVSYSRLPVVLNVVYDVPRPAGAIEPCIAAARAWKVPAGVSGAAGYVAYLKNDLLALDKLRLRQVELNAQVRRVPSETKQDMGGAAEYAFRIYGKVNGAPALLPLENTPDVPRLESDAALRSELAAYLVAHAREVDEGTLRLPEHFVAKKVSAFSTFGSARLANKPYSKLFFGADRRVAPELAAFDVSRTRYVKSLEGALARLDDMTCQGCHQGGRSVAGFHALGEDSLARSHPLNVARLGTSPHLASELARRGAAMTTLAEGRVPEPFRPVSFAPPEKGGTLGAPCLMPSSEGAFVAAKACEAGLACTTLAKNPRLPVELGQCLPALTGTGARSTYAHEFAGLPCTSGDVSDAADPMNDALATKTFACRDSAGERGYACRPASIGVPGGLCTRLCADGNVPVDGQNELCAYAGGKEFDECADRNDFSTCLQGAIKAGLREACDESHPCREDYICQRFIKARRTPPEAPASGKGYCVPTYFLFQVRADGHPNPTPTRR